MRPIKYVLTAAFIAFTFFALAQKKKKSPYADYWAQEEIREKFELKTKEAHELFKNGELLQSKEKYKEALILIPKDQKTIAKIRDIDLLIEKKEREKTKPQEPSSKAIEAPVKKSPTIKTLPNEEQIDVNIEPKTKPAKIESTQSVTKKPTKKEVKAPIANTDIVSDNNKPYKNSENYRKYLATIYPIGWTEEFYNEGNKKITKRVLIKGKTGDEYLKVLHHYGATYYFRNGESISYATWVAESSKPK